jgi:hypothetical protein
VGVVFSESALVVVSVDPLALVSPLFFFAIVSLEVVVVVVVVCPD